MEPNQLIMDFWKSKYNIFVERYYVRLHDDNGIIIAYLDTNDKWYYYLDSTSYNSYTEEVALKIIKLYSFI